MAKKLSILASAFPDGVDCRDYMLAYLVIREGSKWVDVIRLEAGRTATIGRASTNKVTITDDRASRFHAEVFFSEEEWVLRDLESRNGTLVNGQPISGDYQLVVNDTIRIANCQLSFVEELSSAFPDSFEADTGVLREHLGSDTNDFLEDSNVLDSISVATITHRQGQTDLLKRKDVVKPDSQMGQSVANLCSLAFDIAGCGDEQEIAKASLKGIFNSTNAHAAAVLLAPYDIEGKVTGVDLRVIESSVLKGVSKYHRVTSFLASTVLTEGEAVLAADIGDDSKIASRDSQGEIASTSIICAPIRYDNRIVGLLHAYSTDGENSLTPADLEFALALSDIIGLALRSLSRTRELAEDLSLSRSEIQQLRSQLEAESEIIGSSPALERVKQDIVQAAPSRATVLIRGESGVGKELIARAVHYSSPRSNGPFVCMNCAALSESLLESELFGHEKGAFTGATDRKVGKFEAADHGTIMLDEIGEMSPSVQAKFLRVLEGHPFERVGGNQPIEVDVRVIAATNRDLEVAVAEGRFRRDLYFRLNVVEILVPPLRKRSEDIELLAYFFLDRFREETGRKITGFSEAAILQLQQYRWPGNVRELKNMVERAVVLCRSTQIEVVDLSMSNLATPDTSEMQPSHDTFKPMSLEDMERLHISKTLAYHDWNKSRTASVLGIERSTLDRKLKRYDIQRPGS